MNKFTRNNRMKMIALFVFTIITVSAIYYFIIDLPKQESLQQSKKYEILGNNL